MPPTRSHQFRRAAISALAITAIAAPAAGARPATEPQSSSGYNASAVAIEPEPAAPAPTVTRAIDAGFDWGSAAVGAGGAAAVLLVSLGGATMLTRRNARVGTVA
jgi:hypothetical protein